MLASGAIDEVERLIGLRLPDALPAMRAIGVREIAACLGGRISLEEARLRGIAATAQYAKRQSTWFRNQLSSEWEFFS
jgi:tRNA dimethylallyltransferase